MRRILIIDNYDSFVYNIAQYVGEIAPESEILVYRNDTITISEIEELNPTHVIISPGPGRPEDAGVSVELVKRFAGEKPILGVCLGHQAIGYALGGKIVHAKKVMHGKTSKIFHTEKFIFDGIENPLIATRYHSLVVDEESFPPELTVTAKSEEDNEIMAIQHVRYPVFGVQFHPESILTGCGKKIIENFLSIDQKVFHNTSPKVLKPKSDPITDAIKKLADQRNLSYDKTVEVMEQIISGKATDAQIAGFLTALKMKGETGEELGGMAKAMQEKSIRIKTPSPKTADTCGTGGDGAGTFNISTATAFVVSAGGVPVAKHGNRSVSSKVGSADVLEAGGYRLDKKPEELEKELEETGFSFLFAPLLHPAMKHVMPARRQLKLRTAFNLLGPITNPARVKYQIVGVFDYEYAPKLALALQKLGTERSIVLSGGFTDELTTCGENRALLVTKDEITPLTIDFEELGLHQGNRNDLRGAVDPEEAFLQIQRVLAGKGSKTQIETVALNAGALLWLVGDVSTIKEGVERALHLIHSGKALDKLKEVMDYQRQAR